MKEKSSLKYIFEERIYDVDYISDEDKEYIFKILGFLNKPLPKHHYLTFEILFKEKYSIELTKSWVEDYCRQLEIQFPKDLNPKFWYKHIFPKYDFSARLKVYNHKIGNRKVDYNLLIEETIADMIQYQESSINNTTEGIDFYRRKCSFCLNSFDLKRIEGYDSLVRNGWYHPTNNILGMTKDHKFSVSDGFYSKIPPYILSHPANCEFMTLRMNSSKNSSSSLSLNKLQERIRLWDDNTLKMTAYAV